MADTSALIAILFSEPERDLFLRRLYTANRACLGAPTLFEFTMVARARRGTEASLRAVTLIQEARLEIIAWTGAMAELADDAFVNYGKGRHPARLNFGDCMSYAVARSLDAPLLYKGNDFAQTDIVSAV